MCIFAGPNQAADPIITRKNEVSEYITLLTYDDHSVFKLLTQTCLLFYVLFNFVQRGELEVVVIKRGDSGTWAFPGGMVDPGEKPSTTVRREFGEEAMAKEDTKSAEIKRLLDSVFNEKNQQILYRGYVDDPRNTDNSVVLSSYRCLLCLFVSSVLFS